MPKREGQAGQQQIPQSQAAGLPPPQVSGLESANSKAGGKAELVVNPAMLANEMKIIRAQSVVPDTFVKVACGCH